MKLIVPDSKRKNKGHYSPGILTDSALYISGQMSVDPDTGLAPTGGIREHVRFALNNMNRVLECAGLTKEHVAQIRIYLAGGIDGWDEVNEAYAEWFGSHRPARCVVPVSELRHGCLVEIEAVAELS